MRTADIIPLTTLYAVGDSRTPGPGVILSHDLWVHYNRLHPARSRPERLCPSAPGRHSVGAIRDVHNTPTGAERGLLCVCTYAGTPEAQVRALALPSVAAQVWNLLAAAAPALLASGERMALPELPRMVQLAVVRPHDVHRPWADHVAAATVSARRDVELAAIAAKRRAADQAARARLTDVLGAGGVPPAGWDGRVTLGWADLDELLTRYAAITRED